MATPIDPRYIDLRTASRYIERGELKQKDYERYLSELPDAAEKAAPVETRQEAEATGDEG